MKIKKILLRISGGLGNQIFQMGYAYSFSKKIKCDLEINSYYQNHFFYKGTKYSDKRDIQVKKLELTNRPIQYTKNQECPFLDIPLKIRLFRLKFFKQTISKLIKVIILDDYFQSQQDFLVTEIVLPEFRKNIKKSLIPDLKNKIGLHVRAGDLLNQPWNNHCNSRFYQKCIKQLANSHKKPQIDVISENQVYAKTLLQNINAKFHFLYPSDPISDFLRLASYGRLICANSSFSWWAGVLGNAEKYSAPPFFYIMNDKPEQQPNEVIVNY